MKFYLIIPILITASGINLSSAQVSKSLDKTSVNLRIITYYWEEKSWGQSEFDTVIFCLYKGQEFGDNNSASLFRLIDIIDSKTVKIGIPDGCQGLGDFPKHANKNNPMIISGSNNCFRINNPELKVDYCIDLLKVNF